VVILCTPCQTKKFRIISDALVHSLRFLQHRAIISVYSIRRTPFPVVAVHFVRYKLNLYICFRLIIDFNRLKATSQILNEQTYITAMEVYPVIIISNLFLLSFYGDLIETCFFFLWRCDPTRVMATSFTRFSKTHTTTHHSR
jgi:hypothetical protein